MQSTEENVSKLADIEALTGMPDPTKIERLVGKVSDEEWKIRVELAALYRLAAVYGWTDLIFTHISARLPDENGEERFLINPYGVFFEEMTASSLVKIDLEGNIIGDTPYTINPAGFTIHSAVHAARHDAGCVMHVHTPYGVAVSVQKGGLKNYTQFSMIVGHDLAYHDYEGIALDLDERERIVADLGGNNLLMLRNHGTLTVGENCGIAFLRMYFLENACKTQILAQSVGGAEHLHEETDELAAHVGNQSTRAFSQPFVGKLVWPGLLRKLAREKPGFDY